MNEKLIAFERLLGIMDELREKCPWDKKQTIESIRHLTIEETYELSDAILEKDPENLGASMDKIKKELGDLLLHIVFYSRIASETNQFTIADVCNSLCEKLIHRHPHIYGDVKVKDEHEVKSNWEKLKLLEGEPSEKEGKEKSALGGVPVSLPAMIKAYRIQEKARGVGFDWEKPAQVWDKVEEELMELKKELLPDLPPSPVTEHPSFSIGNQSPGVGRQSAVEEEFGDLLFALINYARFINVNPEDALERTNRKFIKRFQYLEKESAKEGKQLSNMSLAEMDVYWNQAKKLQL